MTGLPEPHPLDFDWRFTSETTEQLLPFLMSEQPVLAIGTPSVARRFEELGREVLLIDRQPVQGVRNHLRVNVGDPSFQVESTVAIIDPPWYLPEITYWSAWTATLVGVGGKIFLSLWPNDVRPNATKELESFMRWTSEWADVEPLALVPRYDRPLFERSANEATDDFALSSSPGYGQFLILHVREIPALPICPSDKGHWARFLLNNYQLAVRVEQECGFPRLGRHPKAQNWMWPYVSRRAPERDLIGLWSSQNEVAVVTNAAVLIETLKTAFGSDNPEVFEAHLARYPELLEWRLPRPPYWRYLEWQHQQ
ncbi:hypothetical protein [Rhizobium leguminosarum]|uniref:hypothetical protein n=1 Tax=Rhizobium leguminosarum TaxID=384 RepID=UPI003F9490B4